MKQAPNNAICDREMFAKHPLLSHPVIQAALSGLRLITFHILIQSNAHRNNGLVSFSHLDLVSNCTVVVRILKMLRRQKFNTLPRYP